MSFKRSTNFSLNADGSFEFMQVDTTSVQHISEDRNVNPYTELRIWGVTKTGQSIVLLIDDYKPYFYVHLNPRIRVASIIDWLNTYLHNEYKGTPTQCSDEKYAIAIEPVQRKSIMGYLSQTVTMYKITMQ